MTVLQVFDAAGRRDEDEASERYNARLAHTLSWLAGAVSVTILVAGPLGYWWLSYQGESKEAAIAARLHAVFLTQAVGGDAAGWQQRVSGLIDADLAPGTLPEQRSIVTAEGVELGTSGPMLAWPVLAQSAPLATADAVLGQVLVSRSLRPVLLRTGAVAALAALLGGAVFVSLRLLPLRVLRRTLDKLRSHEMEARQRAEEQLRIVLDNAVEGVIVFRPDGQLLSVNQAATAMLGYDDAELAGLSITALLRPPEGADALAVGQFQSVMWRKGGAQLPVEVGVSDMNVQGAPQRIAIVRDITERLQNEARLAHLANYDSLTGLPNRSLFRDRLLQAMARTRRTARSAALMFIDLDRFKNINDSLGHEVGDQLLVGVAGRLAQCLRATDSLTRGNDDRMDVFRLGGDEFTVLVEDLAADSVAAQVAQRILSALAAPFLIPPNEMFISGSIGITLYRGDADTDIDALIKQADLAMYRAKEQGRDGYSFFDEALNQDLLARHKREGQLRRALERGEFQLCFQPKVALLDGRVCGVEALLRWQPSGEPAVMPDKFIPILEETGLIVPVGAWVIREACRQMIRWQASGRPALSLAVNLSSRQFRQPTLTEDIAQVLAESGFPPSLLEIELTESMLIEDSEAVLRILHELGRMGVQIAIDDFGTGHSSLSYLKRFDIDTLKIDRAFVRDIPHDAEDCAIARAVIALAHGLGLKVVAEGVETAAQLAFLATQGCEQAQGYLFSRPLAAPAFEQWMIERGSWPEPERLLT